MPHVSKEKLDEKTKKKLLDQTVEFFVLDGKKSQKIFFEELLTDTERIMLIKRMAAALLLSESVSLYKIAQQLHLSTSTAKRFYREYERGRFDKTIATFGRHERKKKDMWKLIELISRAGMPSMGKERWKNLRTS